MLDNSNLLRTRIKTFASKAGNPPQPEEMFFKDSSEMPENSGIIVYTHARIVGCACACTRNLRVLSDRLARHHARILYSFPATDRDSQARRIWRSMRAKLSHEEDRAGYTFYFDMSESIHFLFEDLKKSWTCSTSGLTASRAALKALVLRSIGEVAKTARSRTLRVRDIVAKTHQYVDGLEIELYLNWLVEDGLIKFDRWGDLFSRKVALK